MSLEPIPIRLFCDLANRSQVIDLNTSAAAAFYRGDDIEIDIGIGLNGNLLTGLANIANVTCQIFQSENDTNPPMMAQSTSTFNSSLTQAEWTNDTSPYCHAAFVFPNSQTGIALNGTASQAFWIRITAQTTDSPAKMITLLDGPITVKDGPLSAVSSVPPGYFRLYTVNGNIVPQIYDPVSGHYYNLEIDTESGIRSLSLGDTAY